MDSPYALYQEALKEPMTCFVFCGGDDQMFADAVAELIPLLGDEYCLALLSENTHLDIEAPNLRVVRDSQLAGSDFLRSAFRQDPDAVLIDARSRDSLPTLAQAKLTGHRVFLHHPQCAREAFSHCFSTLSKEGEFLAMEFLNRSIFVELDKAGPKEVLQGRKSGESELSLASLLEQGDEGWTEREPFEHRPQPQSFSTVPEVMEIPKEWPESGEPFLQELRTHLEPHLRTAWAPVLGTSGQPGEFGRFGGTAELQPGEEWPCCGCCGAPLCLVLQVTLEKAPEPFRRRVGEEGYFQFFYCISGSCSVKSAWEPFQGNSLARRISGETSKVKAPSGGYEEIPIVGWTAVPEGPGWEDRFALPIPKDFLNGDLFSTFAEMAQTESDGYYDEAFAYFGLLGDSRPEIFDLVRTLPGDKLLGWPFWSQGVEYPQCPTCGAQMEMLGQINNDGFGTGAPGFGSALGQVFAGDGNGHVSHCPQHGQMTFAWACG